MTARQLCSEEIVIFSYPLHRHLFPRRSLIVNRESPIVNRPRARPYTANCCAFNLGTMRCVYCGETYEERNAQHAAQLAPTRPPRGTRDKGQGTGPQWR